MADKAVKPMSRAELEQKIIALAWKDDAFRKAFLADPKKAFEDRLGTKLPPDLKITAFAEDENHLHFVIPAKPSGLGELSEADLEKVAGGVDFIFTVLTAVAASTVSLVSAGVSVGATGAAKDW